MHYQSKQSLYNRWFVFFFTPSSPNSTLRWCASLLISTLNVLSLSLYSLPIPLHMRSITVYFSFLYFCYIISIFMIHNFSRSANSIRNYIIILSRGGGGGWLCECVASLSRAYLYLQLIGIVSLSIYISMPYRDFTNDFEFALPT